MVLGAISRINGQLSNQGLGSPTTKRRIGYQTSVARIPVVELCELFLPPCRMLNEIWRKNSAS